MNRRWYHHASNFRSRNAQLYPRQCTTRIMRSQRPDTDIQPHSAVNKKRKTFTIMQRISIIIWILVRQGTAGALVEERFNAEVLLGSSTTPGIGTATTLDVEPTWLSHCNTHKNNDNHMACGWHVVALFSLEVAQLVPSSTTAWPKYTMSAHPESENNKYVLQSSSIVYNLRVALNY